MSLWVYPPVIIESVTQDLVLKLADPNWSLDFATWESDATVNLALRRYPGDRLSDRLSVQIDCASRCGVIGDRRFSLDELDKALEQALNLKI